jgi:integrase
MRQRTGYLYKEGKSWVARVTYTDETGKRRNKKRYRPTKTEARNERDKLLRELTARGEAFLDGDKLTFQQVADRYADLKITEPKFIGDKKIQGMKSHATARLFLDVLTAYFGKRKMKSIRHIDIETFKQKRLEIPTRANTQRSIASVNRELQLLRTIFIFAERQGWIDRNPFHAGDPLINRAAENRRNRILTYAEEELLLAQCIGKRAHLRPLIIAAIESGMRRGELFKLTWADVDLAQHRIIVRARNAKAGKERTAIITDRLADELRRIQKPDSKPDDLVFGITTDVKHSFVSACKDAGIENLHFHDLRHSFITRSAAAGILPTVSMKLAGHEDLEMHSRYLNPDANEAERVRQALNRLNLQRDQFTQTSTLVN